MKKNSKNRILEAGARIIHLKGFHNTGLQEILQAAGLPKGSFYNYFKNKEDFGLQLVDYFIDFFSSMVRPVLDDPTITPLEKIEKILDWFMEFFKSKDYAYGCPIGNLAQEMGDLSPTFRDKLKAAMEAMVDIYTGLLAEAQKQGLLSQQIEVREAAYFLVSSWHGALIHMKAQKGLGPLQNHKRFIFEYVLSPHAPGAPRREKKDSRGRGAKD
jgi:TetR/AcrR family transcriptional regulator, transcriptional repressor for nem operon